MAQTVPSESQDHNYMRLLEQAAPEHAHETALCIPTKWENGRVQETDEITYEAFTRRVQAIIESFEQEGLKKGDRVIVLFPVSTRLYAVLTALFAAGLTAVFIDARMPLKRIAYAVKVSQAKAAMSMKKFFYLRFLIPTLRRMRLYSVDSSGWGVQSLIARIDPGRLADKPFSSAAIDQDHEAIVTFTSGTTGRPKAANRNHDLLLSQTRCVEQAHTNKPTQVCLTCFPVFALYGLTHGMSVILPAGDLTKVDQIDAKATLNLMEDRGVDVIAGGPAFLATLAEPILCGSKPPLEGVALIVVGGAPLTKKLFRRLRQCFPEADIYAAYGSTEVEPIAYSLIESIMEQSVDGCYSGIPIPEVTLRVAQIPQDLPIPEDASILPELDLTQHEAPVGEPGEIIVRGRHVLKGYLDDKDTQKCKLKDEQGQVWHRMGDVAYKQEDGSLVLVGRYNDRITIEGQARYPLILEMPINEMEWVRRCALIERDGELTLFIEKETPASSADTAAVEDAFAAKGFALPKALLVPKIPVDARHQAKVDRAALATISLKDSTPLHAGS